MATLTFTNFQTAPPPRCPVHGQMHSDFAMNRWICKGYDGEGCDYQVRYEDLDWTFLSCEGTIEGVKFIG